MKLRLANVSDDDALRALVRQDAMPGWIRMAYGREPSFFHGLSVEGDFAQAFVFEDRTGEVRGQATRAIKRVWLDGEPTAVGYLGGLRIHPAARGSLGLARGFAFLRRLHRDERCELYFTTITTDNERAQAVLTSGRGGLPHYLPAGRVCFHAMAPSRLARTMGRVGGLRVVTGATVGEARMLAFFEEHGRAEQFFPRLGAGDLNAPQYRGLELDDFLVVLNTSGTIQGAAALWDQRAYKQLHVTGYAAPLAAAMPVARLGIRGLLGIELPRSGDELLLVYLAFPCIAEHDPAVLRALLGEAGQRLRTVGVHCLLAAWHQGHPLAQVDVGGLSYDSELYLVCWDEAITRCRALLASRRPFHVEAATI